MDEKQFNYFNITYAMRVHDWIIDNSGGLHGIRDIGVLESVLEHIQNDYYYPNFMDKLCHLFFSINKFHAFSDGNKRSGIALSSYFLEINELGHCIHDFVREMENIAVWVANGSINKDLLNSIIQNIIQYGELVEETKLEVAIVVSNHELL